MLEIKKTKYALGAFVQGLDLTKKISDLEFELLLKALAENEVLFFRDQHINHKDHKRVASLFGDLQTHPAYPTVEGFPEITILELSLIHI